MSQTCCRGNERQNETWQEYVTHQEEKQKGLITATFCNYQEIKRNTEIPGNNRIDVELSFPEDYIIILQFTNRNLK